MKLVEAWQDTAIREGFALGRPLKEIAAETGLSTLEVFQRQLALKAMPSIEAPNTRPVGSARVRP